MLSAPLTGSSHGNVQAAADNHVVMNDELWRAFKPLHDTWAQTVMSEYYAEEGGGICNDAW